MQARRSDIIEPVSRRNNVTAGQKILHRVKRDGLENECFRDGAFLAGGKRQVMKLVIALLRACLKMFLVVVSGKGPEPDSASSKVNSLFKEIEPFGVVLRVG